jgi:hypothetical protein
MSELKKIAPGSGAYVAESDFFAPGGPERIRMMGVIGLHM